MKQSNTIDNILQALEYGQRTNLLIGGETMSVSVAGHPHSIGWTLVERVKSKILAATGTTPVFTEIKDIFDYPYSAVDNNPLSPYSVY